MLGKFRRLNQKSNGLLCPTSIHLPPKSSVIKSYHNLNVREKEREKKYGDGNRDSNSKYLNYYNHHKNTFGLLPSHAQVWLHPAPRFCLNPPVPPGQTLTTLRMWLRVHLWQGDFPHYRPAPVTPFTSPALTTDS